MATIRAFKAVRPRRDLVHLVSSRAFYTYPQHVLDAKLDSNPYSFIHIINPEFREKKYTAPNSHERFKKVRKRYDKFKKKGYFVEDTKPSLYIYRQSSSETSFTGLIGCAGAEDYSNGTIKKHEKTLTAREEVFKNYLDICGFHAEPVLLTYPNNDPIEAIVDHHLATRPEYDFTTTDEKRHELWIIEDPQELETIDREFKKFNSIYIADGHHRSASSALLAEEKADGPDSPYNFFMAFFIPEKELTIYDFNRLVKDINGHTAESLLEAIRENFDVKKMGKEPYAPKTLHEMGLYLDGDWYSLKCKKGTFDDNDPVASLDAEILTNNILSPILGIEDLKTDDRITFEGGPDGLDRLIDKVNQGKAKAAFTLFPVTVQQLKDVADANETMPPKTTWIEPKLRSGLTIYEY